MRNTVVTLLTHLLHEQPLSRFLPLEKTPDHQGAQIVPPRSLDSLEVGSPASE